MIGPRRASFEGKLRRIVTLTTCVALAVGSLTIITHDIFSVRNSMAEDLWTLAEIIGANSTAALLFDDAKFAREVLAALEAKPGVLWAGIYDRNDRPLAAWARPGTNPAGPAPEVGEEGYRFASGQLVLFRKIVMGDEVIGTVCIQSDLTVMVSRVRRNIMAVAGAMLVAVLIAVLLSARLRRRVIRPIRQLADVAGKVSYGRDYSIRVPKEDDDELGLLTEAFNNMLTQIQLRDEAVRKANDDLERRVQQRTAQLKQQVTERVHAERALRRSEEQLRQSQKMEAIGRLAGGVAHDFNNLLTAIMGYADLMINKLDPVHPLMSKAEEIRKAGERASNLTRQLLAFSRKQVLAPKVLDLGSVIGNMEKMLRRLIDESIAFEALYGENLASVEADPGQIEQVVMNLVVNARDAMPDGGRLTITVRNFELTGKDESCHPDMTPGTYLLLEVADNGCGMDQNTCARIFEPFFTTKEQGRGTGLGLSTAYGIVRQSGGFMRVDSEPGNGTVFRIYLRAVDGTVEAAPSEPERQEAPAGTETILLVEDEDMVRDLASEILEMNGYRVLEAPDGASALELTQSRDVPIDLMITDMVMPHMNGPALYERVAELRPEMKVLFMSGYTETAIDEDLMRGPGCAFIQKPFSANALANIVRRMLDGEECGLAESGAA